MYIYEIIQYIIFAMLALSAAYILFFAVAGHFYKEPLLSYTERYRRIAVLIPGYKEDAVIVDTAEKALQQQYPMSAFDVVVIADSFAPATMEKLKTLPIKLIPVSFEKSTKAKALNAAMQQLDAPYEIAVVLDADNIMADDFLAKINAAFENGYRAVQGHRTAKNINNAWAILDAISENINNHLFRKGHRAVGLSSAIIGSGMAFDYPYFKQMMAGVHAVGGFDKEIELKMLKEGIKIAYLNSAVVYDEKIQETKVFSNQRRRWLSAQLHYFRVGFGDALKDLLLKGNIDYFDKALQFILPPRVLLLSATVVLAVFFTLADILIVGKAFLFKEWLVLVLSVVAALLLSVSSRYYNKKTFLALTTLPKAAYAMLLSLLRIKGANKSFIHTAHTTRRVENNH